MLESSARVLGIRGTERGTARASRVICDGRRICGAFWQKGCARPPTASRLQHRSLWPFVREKPIRPSLSRPKPKDERVKTLARRHKPIGVAIPAPRCATPRTRSSPHCGDLSPCLPICTSPKAQPNALRHHPRAPGRRHTAAAKVPASPSPATLRPNWHGGDEAVDGDDEALGHQRAC